MSDILRAFRLGIINLLGVTVPGLMFIITLVAGVAAPLVLLLNHLSKILNPWLQVSQFPNLPPLGTIPVAWVIVLTIIMAYTIGYIIRLSTPDKLDVISGKHVVRKMGGPDSAKKEHWPYRQEPDNKFPYFHTKDYLEHRGHTELLELVNWGQNPDENTLTRSKTIVNKMKIETAMRSPELSAIIESNEAHIRLLFGVWLVAKICRPYLIFGFVCTVIGMAMTLLPIVSLKPISFTSPYPIWFVVVCSFLIGVSFAKKQIEKLFHYRRVRELVDIIVCTYWARKVSVGDVGINKEGDKKKATQKEGKA